MPSGSNAIDDDDDVAKLMPNMTKLIRSGESDSLESKGSTSMSLSGNSVKENFERENVKPSRQRRRESVFRDVANKFLRRGAFGTWASKSSAMASLSSNCRVGSPSEERLRNAYMIEKENVRPKSPILIQQGARSILQQKMTIRTASQKVARKRRKLPSCSEGSSYFSVNSKIQKAERSKSDFLSEHLAQPASTKASKASRSSHGTEHFAKLAGKTKRGKVKLYRTTMPLDLSELKEEFAQIDEEALEEEEVSIVHMTRVAPVVASETLLHHADDIQQKSVEDRKYLSGSERKKVVRNTVNSKPEDAALPIYSEGHEQEGLGICNSHSTSGKTPGQVQDVRESEETGKGNDGVSSSGHDRNAITCPVRQPSPPDNLSHNLDDGNQADSVKGRNEENPPLIEQDSANPCLKGVVDQVSVGANGRTCDTKATPCQLEACVLEMSGKGTSVCAEFELANAEGGCNDKKGYPPTNPNMDKLKGTMVDGPKENAAHQEHSVPRHSSTFRDVQSSPSKANHLLEQEDVPDIPLQAGNFSTPDTSATPSRLHYSRRRRRIIGINQRRLAFESGSDSKQKTVARAMDSDSRDVSVSAVEVKGKTNSDAGIINRDGHEINANVTSVPDQEAKLALADDVDVGQLDDRYCMSHSSKPQAATHIEGVVNREMLSTGSLAQDDNRSAFQASREMGKDPYCFNSLSPQAGSATEGLKIRGLGKRTWANLGAPIDGGSEWKEGRRQSTRIKSRPLDWWRGERMLYGRVHSTLCTLIGIKTASPDPVWPRPKPQRGDYTMSNFHVDSFVDDSHCELLRLAAQ